MLGLISSHHNVYFKYHRIIFVNLPQKAGEGETYLEQGKNIRNKQNID